MNWEELHAQAVLQLLQGDADMPVVYDNGVPRGSTATTYVVAYMRSIFTQGSPRNALDGTPNTIQTTATVYAVAPHITACRVVMYQVRHTLLGARPVISGRSCGLIEQVDALDAHRDDTTGAELFSAITVFEFPST
jgi:hypothetical protein